MKVRLTLTEVATINQVTERWLREFINRRGALTFAAPAGQCPVVSQFDCNNS